LWTLYQPIISLKVDNIWWLYYDIINEKEKQENNINVTSIKSDVSKEQLSDMIKKQEELKEFLKNFPFLWSILNRWVNIWEILLSKDIKSKISSLWVINKNFLLILNLENWAKYLEDFYNAFYYIYKIKLDLEYIKRLKYYYVNTKEKNEIKIEYEKYKNDLLNNLRSLIYIFNKDIKIAKFFD